jgi:hypothetical protein
MDAALAGLLARRTVGPLTCVSVAEVGSGSPVLVLGHLVVRRGNALTWLDGVMLNQVPGVAAVAGVDGRIDVRHMGLRRDAALAERSLPVECPSDVDYAEAVAVLLLSHRGYVVVELPGTGRAHAFGGGDAVVRGADIALGGR